MASHSLQILGHVVTPNTSYLRFSKDRAVFNLMHYTTAHTHHLFGIISPQEMNQNPSVPTNPFDITNYVVALPGNQINLLLT